MTITADEFMLAAFAGLDREKELPAVSCARLNQKGQLGFPAAPYQTGTILPRQPWHFNITTFRLPERGEQFYARLSLAVSTRVIVLDDIGDHEKSKVSWATFNKRAPPPHYVLATREEQGKANCQIGYFLEPTEPDHANALIQALIKAEFTDPGMRSANRWARLPGSTKHGGTYAARVLEWDPPRIVP